MDATFLTSSFALAALAYSSSQWLARRNPALSPGYLAIMFLLILANPIFRHLPKIEFTTPVFQPEILAAAQKITSAESSFSVLTLIWLSGVAILLIRQIHARLIICTWRQRAEKFDSPSAQNILHEAAKSLAFKKLPKLILTLDLDTPAIAGILRPVIFLPKRAQNWSENTLRMVLLHEMAHLKRRDLFISLIADLTCALHWFNPLVWLLKNRLRRDCEFACDAKLIRLGTSAKAYALALCEVAEQSLKARRYNDLILAMASGSALRSRVENVLRGSPRRGSSSLAVLVFLSLSLAAAMALVRFENPIKPAHVPQVSPIKESTNTPQEVNLRKSADPFPAD